MLVHYCNRGLEATCALPRWADVIYLLEQDPRVLLIVLQAAGPNLCWLHVLGRARPDAAPNWSELLPDEPLSIAPRELYQVIHVTPDRVEWISQRQGFEQRETLAL